MIHNRYRVAVIGSGPSGFYFTKYLLKSKYFAANAPSTSSVHVDIIDRLPTPFGLVRFGVAPDHPEVKSVQNDFTEVMETKDDKGSNSVRFFGNVHVGDNIGHYYKESHELTKEEKRIQKNVEKISIEELKKVYDAIVFAYGAQSDRHLGIKGESSASSKSVMSARTFVGWYNGHPDFANIDMNLEHISTVAIVGHGNVALDCARVLVKDINELKTTDIVDHAIEKLLKSKVKKVYVFGRRGHPQASFTMKELREMTKLSEAKFIVNQKELDDAMTPASLAEIENQRPTKRMDKLLRETIPAQAKSKSEKSVEIKFLSNPVEIINDANGNIKALKIEKTKLEGEQGNQKAIGTGVFEEIPCQLLLRSIGYKSEPVNALDAPFFDKKKSTMKNMSGKVSDGFYCAGWLKRGPSGIIGTNINDARETLDTLMHDIENGKIRAKNNSDDPLSKLKNAISWELWKKIDEEEKRRGSHKNPPKPREKMTSIDEMVDFAKRV